MTDIDNIIEEDDNIGKTEEECKYIIARCRKLLYHCDGLDDLVNVELLQYRISGGADLHDLSVVRESALDTIEANQKRHYELFSKRMYGGSND